MPKRVSTTVIIRATFALGMFLGASLLALMVTAQPIDSPSTYSEAIGFFAQEKTIGETGAALLKTFREKITAGQYARGGQYYGMTKAAYDGLITQLNAEAADTSAQASSERFQAVLRQAAEARIAFTNYVENTLGPNLEGTKFPFTVIFEAVAELLPKLADAWNKIWEERRQAQKERLQEVQRQLKDVTWRPFNDIEAIQ